MQSQPFVPTHPNRLQYDSVRPNMLHWQPLHQGYGYMMQISHSAVMRPNTDTPSWPQQQTPPSFTNVYNPVGSIAQLQSATNRPEQHWLSCVVDFTQDQASTFLERAKNLRIESAPKTCSRLSQEIVQAVCSHIANGKQKNVPRFLRGDTTTEDRRPQQHKQNETAGPVDATVAAAAAPIVAAQPDGGANPPQQPRRRWCGRG